MFEKPQNLKSLTVNLVQGTSGSRTENLNKNTHESYFVGLFCDRLENCLNRSDFCKTFLK